MPKQAAGKIIFFVILLIRLIGPVILWYDVIVAFIISALVDGFDGDILAEFSVKRKWYQKYDKYLDLWWLIILFAYFLILFPIFKPGWYIIVLSFVVRAIGSALYMITNQEWLLFVFPNISNWLFIIYLYFPNWLSIGDFGYYPILTILVLVALWKEWQLHVAKIDMTHFFFPFKPPKKW